MIPRSEKKGKIGIITGSGPEAGIDLWRKILDANRRQRGFAPCLKHHSNKRIYLSTEVPTLRRVSGRPRKEGNAV